MTTQPRLVNKQFNTPIGLYSEQSIRDVIEREKQILGNGAVGIDFHNPSVGKPTNLQNSAVLRMLEEEEQRQRSGRAGHDDYIPKPLRDVVWPPAEHDHTNHLRSSFKDVVIPGVKRVAWPPPQEGILDPLEAQAAAQVAAQPQGGYQYPNQSPNINQNQNNYPAQHAAPYQQPSQAPYRPLKPLDVSSVGSGSPLASPHVNQSPQGFRPATPSKGWAPVHSPASTPQYQSPQQQFGVANQRYQSQPQHQPVSQPYQQPGQQYQSQQYQVQQTQQYQSTQYQQEYQTPSQQHYQTSSQQQYQPQSFAQTPQQPQPVAAQAQAAPRPQAKHVEPPPSTITLRQQAPVSQPSPPVYSAQPATASLKVVVGGRNLRGDLKWPPEDVKFQIEEENRQRIELAKGPAFRPKRKDKDYTRFFEEHALNSSYPGYKVPPGTQFYRPL